MKAESADSRRRPRNLIEKIGLSARLTRSVIGVFKGQKPQSENRAIG